ncbi:uncharacterized protein [Polyergus mexicanus]|uniref:uncharacterized protein n=1 Tax=Polyergus mexicanus TaxID=615972 RepID=UPI0038B53BCC
MNNSAVILALIALVAALVGDVAALCREIANEDMLEYSCEGGQPSDLITIPERTEKLRITGMPLGRITADTFARFGESLWVLSCSHCEITDIDVDAFRRLVNLQQLSLNNNYLTTVKASWLKGLHYLTYVDLNYNNIRDIEDDVYRNLPNLVDFRISGNQLRCLNLNEMLHLKELKRIFLNENSDFACPHAISKFLENQGIAFEPDPEWRRLASDTIDVPPSYAEEDHRTLNSDKRPEQPEVPYISPTRDRPFYPDQHAEHRHRHKRPTTTVRPTTPKQQNEIPRVEPRFPSRTSPPDSFSRQIMPYPLPTPETLPAPPMEWRPSEDITHRYMEITTNHGLSQTEHVSMYPQHVPTYEMTYYPKDYIFERLRAAESTAAGDHETTVKPDRSSQAGNTLIYPLYAATSNDRERLPHGSIQVMHPTDSDIVTADSTDHSNQHPYWIRHESFPPPTVNLPPSWSASTPDLYETPYHAEHDSRKMIVDESSNIDNVPIATNSADQVDRTDITTTPLYNWYNIPVTPSIPKWIYLSPSSSDDYQAPQDYQTTVNDDLTTTEDPLPKCPKSSANSLSIQSYIALLVMSVIITVFGHVIAEGF